MALHPLVTMYLMACAEDWSFSRAYLSQKSMEAMLPGNQDGCPLSPWVVSSIFLT